MNSTIYKQPIIIFGIAIPLILTVLVIGSGALLLSKMAGSLDTKSQYYSGHEATRTGALQMEADLSKQKDSSERWQELVSQETSSLVTTNLRTIAENLPPKEFQQTAFERLGSSTGLGKVSAQKSSGLRFNFRGTYRTVQLAFLELESRMPNLQLQELKIDPNSGTESSLLNFQVTYTAWEN